MGKMKPHRRGFPALFRKQKAAPQPETGGQAVPVTRLMSYETAYLHCQGKREQQEDTFVYVNQADVSLMNSQGLLAVVADGMGGMFGGREASNQAIETLQRDFAQMNRQEDIAPQMVSSVHRANDAVRELLNGRGGSTIIACVLFQEKLYYVGAGDSFLYLLRKGQLIRLNREQNTRHRLYQEAIDRGILDPSIADSDPEGAAVTQYLGKAALDDLDYFRRPLQLEKGDVLLLCSDGVAGILDEDCLTQCLSCGRPTAACAAMDQRILQADNPYQDNYTALVIRCDK